MKSKSIAKILIPVGRTDEQKENVPNMGLKYTDPNKKSYTIIEKMMPLVDQITKIHLKIQDLQGKHVKRLK